MMTDNIFANFPDYVPQDVCLSCQGCCRFNDSKSPWRPKISQEERDVIEGEQSRIIQKYSSITVDQNDYVKANEISKPHSHAAVCQCTFFDINKNICKIYKQRPFDCRLYPFLLVKKDEVYYVGVHLNCPFIEKTRHKETFKNHAVKVKIFFDQPEVLEYFRRHTYLAGEFKEFLPEIDCLFKLDI